MAEKTYIRYVSTQQSCFYSPLSSNSSCPMLCHVSPVRGIERRSQNDFSICLKFINKTQIRGAQTPSVFHDTYLKQLYGRVIIWWNVWRKCQHPCKPTVFTLYNPLVSCLVYTQSMAVTADYWGIYYPFVHLPWTPCPFAMLFLALFIGLRLIHYM